MKHQSYRCIVLFWLLAPAVYSEPEKERNCLDIAADFADRICGKIERTGVKETVEANGELKASVSGYLKKALGEFGAEISANGARERYENVLQKDLGNELFDVRDCRRKMAEAAVKQACKQNILFGSTKSLNETSRTEDDVPTFRGNVTVASPVAKLKETSRTEDEKQTVRSKVTLVSPDIYKDGKEVLFGILEGVPHVQFYKISIDGKKRIASGRGSNDDWASLWLTNGSNYSFSIFATLVIEPGTIYNIKNSSCDGNFTVDGDGVYKAVLTITDSNGSSRCEMKKTR